MVNRLSFRKNCFEVLSIIKMWEILGITGPERLKSPDIEYNRYFFKNYYKILLPFILTKEQGEQQNLYFVLA